MNPSRVITCGRPGDSASTLVGRLLDDASTPDIAVILVDARSGVTMLTRELGYVVSLAGVPNVVLAVEGLDRVDGPNRAFEAVVRDYRTWAARIAGADVTCIPVSAPDAHDLTTPGAKAPWYPGPTLHDYLETVKVDDPRTKRPFRMPVQRVERAPGSSAEVSDQVPRSCHGRIVGGSVRRGTRVRALPSGKDSTVMRIVSGSSDVDEAFTGQSVTLTLADAVDIGPGDMLSAADSPAGIADQFEASLIWTSEAELLPGRSYLLRIGTKTVGASVATPKYKINTDTLEHLAAKTLHHNEIGVCNLNLDQPVPFDPYAEYHDTGSFVLIDRATNDTIAGGMLHFALRRSQNIHWQAIEVNKKAHAALNGHRPCIVWFTGLSGAGKSTIANLVEKRLHALGHHTYLLDGDNVRHGLNKDLGFTEADRVENIRRVAEVARLMVDAGLIVLVSFISPFASERRMARTLVAEGEFHEVFVDAPLEVAESRDAKGLYKKARRGELKNFTGIDSPYEPPEHPEIRIDTTAKTPADAAEMIVTHLQQAGAFDAG